MFAQYEPYLQAALDRSDPGTSIDEVKEAIRRGDAYLWPGEASAAVTQVDDSKRMHVWLVGGDFEELMKMEAACCKLAKDLGCVRMTAEDARPGWRRVLELRGYREIRLLVKDI